MAGRWVIADERGLIEERSKMMKAAGRHGTLGLEIFFAVVLGVMSGSWLDGKLGTGPWLSILLTLCGLVAAGRAMVRVTREYKAELKRQAEKEEGQG
jgi:ATP synthase protein I